MWTTGKLYIHRNKVFPNINIILQVPVACKACPCGHLFFNARKNSKTIFPGDDFLRRTQRVRREKPNYYDSLEYDKQVKKVFYFKNKITSV